MARRAALLTPPGPGGIAVVRVAGDDLPALLEAIFQTRHPVAPRSIQDNRLRFGILCDGPDRIDQVVVAYNPAAGCLDINCHGGPRIVQRLLMLLRRHGAEVCHWSHLAQETTIEQESRRWLPEARTTLAALALAAQHPGGLSRWSSLAIGNIQDDFWPLARFRQELRQVLASWPLGQRLLHPARLALAGAPNAGKSTLANHLCGQTQSLVAPQAGTTRDWTEHTADIEGVPVVLVDTAGWREGQDELEREAARQAARQIEQADLVLLTVAADDNPGEVCRRQSAAIPPGKPVLTVITKSDLADALEPVGSAGAVSARTGAGIDALRRAIAAQLGFAGFDPAAPLVFTQRQYDILTAAGEARDEYSAILILYRLWGGMGG